MHSLEQQRAGMSGGMLTIGPVIAPLAERPGVAPPRLPPPERALRELAARAVGDRRSAARRNAR
jgi:hypothetical protein